MQTAQQRKTVFVLLPAMRTLFNLNAIGGALRGFKHRHDDSKGNELVWIDEGQWRVE